MFFPASVVNLYTTWQFIRSFLHRGWWLVTSLYLVTQAGLSPIELVILGTAQGLVVLATEVPAGVFADTYSRKLSLVIAHVLMGLGMISTGLVQSLPALMLTQMIWGLSWAFASGADVAWLTDELDDPENTKLALIKASKWSQAGSALGILTLGGLAWSTNLATAMITAGSGIWLLGLAVFVSFRETNFIRSNPGSELKSAACVLREGTRYIRSRRILIHILLCTYLVNGADEAFVRLYAKQLIDLGLPSSAAPIIWLSILTVAALSVSLLALSATSRYLSNRQNYARAYSVATLIGALGLAIFAMSSTPELACFGIVLISGIATPVMRTVSVVWSNEHTESQVRATVQSCLSVAENLGEVSLGFCIAIIAELLGIPWAMIASCITLLAVFMLVEYRSKRTNLLH